MRLFVCLGLAALSVFGAADSSTESLISRMPLRFERNSEEFWTARSLGFAIRVGGDSAVIRLGKEAFRLRFEGADPAAPFIGEKKANADNIYIEAGGTRSADAYMQLRQKNIYPGVDLVYYGSGQNLEYDFDLAPGADASQIRMRFDGVLETRLSEDGSLILKLRNGDITQKPPVTYQRSASGEIVSVVSRYVAEDNGAYSLRVDEYDKTRPLIVDPQILFTWYLQGTGSEGPLSINLDKDGVIYIAGFTYSTDFPLVCCQPTDFNLSGSIIAFITKMDTRLSDFIVYSGFFGGSFGDTPRATTADADGLFYLTGIVDDKFFPTTSNAFSQDNRDTRKMFLSVIDTKLGRDGLVYSTFFGGNLTGAQLDGEQPTGIALGPVKGQVFITGFTSATDFPTKNPTQGSLKGLFDGFVAEFDITKSGESSLIASTYLGGSAYDIPESIVIDAAGKAYITGYTQSSDYPVTEDANQKFYAGGTDVFLTRLNASEGFVEYSTFLGGSGLDQAYRVQIDSQGRIALAGFTQSSNFPITPTAMQRTPGGDGDAFLTILNLANTPGQAVAYSTFYGGSGSDVVSDMKIGPTGTYYLGGYTLSRDLRAVDAISPISAATGVDGFVAIIDTTVSGSIGLLHSSYITGPGTATVQGITVDAAGNVYVVGQSLDNVFPPGSAQVFPDTNTNVFVLVFHPSAAPIVRRPSTALPPITRTRR